MELTRSKWFQPAIAAGLGIALLAAMWIGGDATNGVVSLAVMLGVAALSS
jgi:hypothetical protein